MRKTYLGILKKVFYEQLIRERDKRRLTQCQMADKLSMDPRSYIDLDHGKSGCSALTLVLFLIYCCSDVDKFLKTLKQEFEKQNDIVAK